MKTKDKKTKIKKRFSKGFFWGKVEHKLESYTTFFLFLGLMFYVPAILNKKWILAIIAGVFFLLSFFFRIGSGIAHRLEKRCMDILRFGKWKKKLGKEK